METLIRPARFEDAAELARLVDIAGEGLPRLVWADMAEPGETVWDVGQRRAERDEGSFSWRNATVCEVDGQVVAAMMGYPQPDQPDPTPLEDLPPLFRPLQELENKAPGTWYLNVLATFEAYRGQGIGARLIEVAKQKARDAGQSVLSLIVEDSNPALRLYRRAGFAEVARAPIARHPDWQGTGLDWVLMTVDI